MIYDYLLIQQLNYTCQDNTTRSGYDEDKHMFDIYIAITTNINRQCQHINKCF